MKCTAVCAGTQKVGERETNSKVDSVHGIVVCEQAKWTCAIVLHISKYSVFLKCHTLKMCEAYDFFWRFFFGTRLKLTATSNEKRHCHDRLRHQQKMPAEGQWPLNCSTKWHQVACPTSAAEPRTKPTIPNAHRVKHFGSTNYYKNFVNSSSVTLSEI